MIPSRIRSVYLVVVAMSVSVSATATTTNIRPPGPLPSSSQRQHFHNHHHHQRHQQQRSHSNSNSDTLFVENQNLYDLTHAKEDQWMSLNDHVEFLPSYKWEHGLLNDQQIRTWASQQLERSERQQRQQRQQQQQQQQQPVDGSNSHRHLSATITTNKDIYRLSPFVEGVTEYDEYQTAWRLLGFMIDCDDDLSDVTYDDDQYNSGSGSGSGDTGEGCNRYVVWAAVS